jgi:hypothetical protein
MAVLTSLVITSLVIMAGAVSWGWRNGTVRETAQERYDREFERIVRRSRTEP